MKEYVNICATWKYYNATPFHRVAKCIRTQHQCFLTHSNPISVWFRWCTTTAVMFGFPEHTQNCTYKFSHHRGPFYAFFVLVCCTTSALLNTITQADDTGDAEILLTGYDMLLYCQPDVNIYTYMYARWNKLLKEALNKKTRLQKRAC